MILRYHIMEKTWLPSFASEKLPKDLQDLWESRKGESLSIQTNSVLNGIIGRVQNLLADIPEGEKLLITVDTDGIDWQRAHRLFKETIEKVLSDANLLHKILIMPRTKESRNFRNVFRKASREYKISKALIITNDKSLALAKEAADNFLKDVETLIAYADYSIFESFDLPWMPGVLSIIEAGLGYLTDKNISFTFNIPHITSIIFDVQNGVMFIQLNPEIKSEEVTSLHRAEELQLKSV